MNSKELELQAWNLHLEEAKRARENLELRLAMISNEDKKRNRMRDTTIVMIRTYEKLVRLAHPEDFASYIPLFNTLKDAYENRNTQGALEAMEDIQNKHSEDVSNKHNQYLTSLDKKISK